MSHIYSYNPHSEGAKALSNALGWKRIKHQGSRFKPSASKTLINWGASSLPEDYDLCKVLNQPAVVASAIDKLKFFRNMSDKDVYEYVVPYTTSEDIVREWLKEGRTAVARTTLSGHSGQGIVLFEGEGSEIVPAPLYTLYKAKKHEYRIHCAIMPGPNGFEAKVFDIQRKARRGDVANEDVNWKIRNLDGGFIYARQDIALPECVEECAKKIFIATGLDFGAIDIIYNETENKAYALEVNTAPGLAGTTLDKYTEMFKEIVK